MTINQFTINGNQVVASVPPPGEVGVVNSFYPVGHVLRYGADATGATDSSTAFLNAISAFLASRTVHDYGGDGVNAAGPVAQGIVTVPAGTFRVANVLLRSGITIQGAGRAATTVKLLDGVNNIGATGPGNVFCTSLDSTGNYTDPIFGAQTWTEGSVSPNTLDGTKSAGKNGTQTRFIVKGAIVRDMTIDGNKANNNQPDAGGNASVMGSCVSFNQGADCWAIDCTLQNARLDTISLGYTLHGGTYRSGAMRCTMVNPVRCGASLVTGYRNTLAFCDFSGSGSSDVDVEGNWNGEYNSRHTVVGCRGSGQINIQGANNVISENCRVTACDFGRMSIFPSVATGSVVSGCTFDGAGSGIAVTGNGLAVGYGGTQPDFAPVTIIGNTFRNFTQILDGWNAGASGQVSGFIFDDNTFDSILPPTNTVLVQLYRPYKVTWRGNRFLNCGNADGTTTLFNILTANANPAFNQGDVLIKGNLTKGGNTLSRWCILVDGSSPPASKYPIAIVENETRQVCTIAISQQSDTFPGLHIARNDFRQAVDEVAAVATGTIFFDNTLVSPSTTRIHLTGNRIDGFEFGAQGFRHKSCNWSNNAIRNCHIGLFLHSSDTGTFAGQGDNQVIGNQIEAAAAGSTFGIQVSVGANFTAGQTTSSTITGNAIHGFATANLRVGASYVYAIVQPVAS